MSTANDRELIDMMKKVGAVITPLLGGAIGSVIGIKKNRDKKKKEKDKEKK